MPGMSSVLNQVHSITRLNDDSDGKFVIIIRRRICPQILSITSIIIWKRNWSQILIN